MALIKCKECGSEVSSKAETCPKCGARVAPEPMGCGSLIGISLLVVIFLSVFSSLFSNNSSSDPANSTISSTNEVASTTERTPEPLTAGTQWIYSQSEDPMSKGITYHAQTLSTNTVNFDFPYAGSQHARLTLRDDPRYGKDLIFNIEKGQLLCHSYEDCTVLVRFDDDKATNYSAVGAADNSTETIFIRNYGRFVEKMLKAKRVRISMNIYQEGAPIFEFDVSGFDQNKFRPKK